MKNGVGAPEDRPIERHLAAHPQIGIERARRPLAGRPRREDPREIGHGAANIGVMIARHEADVFRRAERFEPASRELELRR